MLPPLDHDDPAHCLVSGTGLTHLGSAATRDRMHQQNQGDETALTDTMRIFRWGLEGGKPPAGQVGAQPEWFYKGDGGIVVRPGADFPLPAFAEDAGEEPEVVGLYLIGDDRRPYRLGYALGNEFSDHLMERRNYLYLAHSKLRACCYGPEPASRRTAAPPAGREPDPARRRSALAAGVPFRRGQHVPQPGEPRVPPFQVRAVPPSGRRPRALLRYRHAVLRRRDQGCSGDVFEIAMAEFGAPLRNGIAAVETALTPGRVVAL